MRFLMDEFIGRNRLNHPVKFELIKQDNGNFRIKRGGKLLIGFSSKQSAIERFEKMKSQYGGGEKE